MSDTNESNELHLAHRVKLVANKEFWTYCRKAAGVQRKTYNWVVDRLKKAIDEHSGIDFMAWKKEFNAIKKDQFPYMYEVTCSCSQRPFFFCQKAFSMYCKSKKEGWTGYKKRGFPKYKKARYNYGSIYLDGKSVKVSYNPETAVGVDINKNAKHQYLLVPKFGWVKMYQDLRFEGHILNCTLKLEGNAIYACFLMKVDKDEYAKTHNAPVRTGAGIGIDVGIKSLITTDTGISVLAPKPLEENQRRIKRAQRCLSRRRHPVKKGDKKQNSIRYCRQANVVRKLHKHNANIRHDFNNKLSSVIVRHFKYIGLEDLNIQGMFQNHSLAQALADVGLSMLADQIKKKIVWMHRVLVEVDMFYPSSKTCSKCGHIKDNLTLKDREYVCPECGNHMDRDYNAAVNIFKYIKTKLGREVAQVNYQGQKAFIDDLIKNGISVAWVKNVA